MLRRSGKPRAEWISTQRALRQKQVALERELGTSILSKLANIVMESSEDGENLQHFAQKQWTHQRNDLLVHQRIFIKDVHDVQQAIQRLKSLMTTQGMNRPPNFIEILEQRLSETEQSLMTMKQRQKQTADTLFSDYKRLHDEVMGWEDRIEQWSSHERQKSAKQEATRRWRQNHVENPQLVPEVIAHQQFLARRGPTGGWDETAHETFLRLRQRLGHKRRVFLDTVSAQTGMAPSSVQEHEDWFIQLQAMNEERRRAISQWRERKAKQDQSSFYDSSAEQNQWLDEETTKQKRTDKVKTSTTVLDQRRLEQKAAVDAWRKEKQMEQQRLEQERQRQEELMERKRAKEELKRQEQKSLVTEFQQVKQQLNQLRFQEEQEQLELERKSRAVDLKQLRDRSEAEIQEWLSKKQALEEQRQRAKLKQEERIAKIKSNVHVHVDKDPERLLKPTVTAQCRVAKEKGATGGKVGEFFRPGGGHVGVRALPPPRQVPSWRRGL